METYAWAHKHFFGAPLGSLRLQRRLVEVAACIRANPCGTLPQAIGGAAALKAAYRMLSNNKVTHAKIVMPHVSATRAQCREVGAYLVIEDTTALSFTQRGAMAGMGPLTQAETQGFLAHTALAVRIEAWNAHNEAAVTVAGLFGQECWVREKPQGTRVERKRIKCANKRKGPVNDESSRWGRAMREAGAPPDGVCWTLVADRECDIFGVLQDCAHHGWGWVIRAAQPRRTVSGYLFETASQAPLLGEYSIALRARPGTPARTARVAVRAVETQLLAPRNLSGKHAPVTTTLIEAKEINPPEGVAPIHWVLLSSWPCGSFEQARSVVGAYTTRWLIEEYHKALKTGTHIEDSQLSAAGRIEALLGIHSVIAVELLQLKLLAHNQPDAPVPPTLLDTQALAILQIRYGLPEGGWTNATALRAVARMGGWLGRKNDGPPGWLSIWRGWLKLKLMAEGYTLALQQQICG